MPKVKRLNVKALYVPLDPTVYAKLQEIAAATNRTLKDEVTFAILEHFEKGPRLMPPHLLQAVKDKEPSKKARKP